MAKKPAAPKNLRNGLVWRDGRPRWEPSPASRAIGLKGLDLRGLDGEWLERGAAIDAADKRAIWALAIREAAQDNAKGSEARAQLTAALENLATPKTADERLARHLTVDLIAAATKLLGEPALAVIAGGGPKSCRALVDAYFADPRLAVTQSTQRIYRIQSARFLARFADRKVSDVTRGQLIEWYQEMLTGHRLDPNTNQLVPIPDYQPVSLTTANSATGAAAAFFRWAMQHDWITHTPATMLGRAKPEGRRVFWTVEEELSFIPWCDANGFPDVADGVIFGLWTAASPVDMCKTDLEDLAGATWRYKRQKTGMEALPALLPAVKARIERRRLSAAQDTVRAMNRTPFLYDFRTQRRHSTSSLSQRMREAKFLALLRDAVPASLEGKRLQDTRDTCITRLYEADVKLDKIPSWTGHSPEDCYEILREHYICLREEGSLEHARKLEQWAFTNGLSL